VNDRNKIIIAMAGTLLGIIILVSCVTMITGSVRSRTQDRYWDDDDIVYVDSGQYTYDYIIVPGATCCYDSVGRYVGASGGYYRHPIYVSYPRRQAPQNATYINKTEITNNTYIVRNDQPNASPKPASQVVPSLQKTLPTVPPASPPPNAPTPPPPPKVVQSTAPQASSSSAPRQSNAPVSTAPQQSSRPQQSTAPAPKSNQPKSNPQSSAPAPSKK
jgi:hypothetical protein